MANRPPSLFAGFAQYARTAFRWQRGRQASGYDKLLLFTWARWPLPFDSYLIHYPAGAHIPPHRDPVSTGRHYRLNIILKPSPAGGEFVCERSIIQTRWVNVFRPDLSLHSVTRVEGGSRYVLSVGWVIRR